ncbi:AAA family ATPase [uncultured Selenomonas sp.]|uniref:AAA family ATPase n=1 Tax=uncultured Selenomonas sp. TaxID=159275 RepID=UPI002676E11E|nr:AAA family ATPase [uncultured Selenomonas sp.]
MKILSLTLENFRSIKNLTVNFDGKDADIYGANGTGKTTIANAICWLLIDRPATEEADFTPKTAGTHGVNHKASMEVELADGRRMTLAKDFYEKWTRKRGSSTEEFTGNVTDYYVDGVKSKKKEYTEVLETVCGIDLERVKMLMVLGYFADTMKTDEKRRILFEMAGEFTDMDVIAANEELEGIEDFFLMPGTEDKHYTVEQWKKIAAEQRKKLNKDLETLPARIDEASKNVAENVEDMEALNAELNRLEEKKAGLEEQKRSLSTEDGKQEAARAALAGLEVDLATRRAAYIEQSAAANQGTNAKIESLREKGFDLDVEGDRIVREKNSVGVRREEMQQQREALLKEYASVAARQWDAGSEICPTCHQPMPQSLIEELRAQFNETNATEKEDINRRGQACSKEKIEELSAREAELTQQIEAIHEQQKKRTKELSELRASLTTLPPFEETQEYRDITARMDELRDRQRIRESASGGTSNAYDRDIAAIKEEIAAVNLRMAKAQSSEDSRKRVGELKQELKHTAEQLEYIEHGIHLCEEFTRTKARMVTDSINEHFRFIRFRLFRNQINGGLREVCEPMVENKAGEWVEYRSANYAAQVNAKLDIVSTLGKHYGVHLPIVMDQGESVTEPLAVDEQLIRLIVSAKDKEIRVEVKE